MSHQAPGKCHWTNTLLGLAVVIIEATIGFHWLPFSFHPTTTCLLGSVLEIYNFLFVLFQYHLPSYTPYYRYVAFTLFDLRTDSIAFAIVCRCVVLKNSTCYNTNEVHHLLLVSGCFCVKYFFLRFVQVPICCFNFVKYASSFFIQLKTVCSCCLNYS